jgi:hypothetical protein
LSCPVPLRLQATCNLSGSVLRRLEEMLPGRMSALRQPGDRRRACEVVEIAHQMRLIGVTAGRGDIRPTAARSAFRERRDAIESNDAGKRLWPEANLSIEPGDEVLAAPADFAGKRANLYTSIRRQQAVEGPGHRGRRFRRRCDTLLNEPFREREATIPGGLVGEAFPENACRPRQEHRRGRPCDLSVQSSACGKIVSRQAA